MLPFPEDIEVKNGDVVAVDLETYDPKLKTHGSGAIVGNGFVCGIAIAYRGETFYFPIKHKGANLDANLIWRVLNKKYFKTKKSIRCFTMQCMTCVGFGL